MSFIFKAAGYNIGFDINKSGNICATGSTDGISVFYNLYSSKIISKFNIFTKPIVQPCMDVKFNQFVNNKIAFSAWNGTICIYDDEHDN
jgi:hypothetical protein